MRRALIDESQSGRGQDHALTMRSGCKVPLLKGHSPGRIDCAPKYDLIFRQQWRENATTTAEAEAGKRSSEGRAEGIAKPRAIWRGQAEVGQDGAYLFDKETLLTAKVAFRLKESLGTRANVLSRLIEVFRTSEKGLRKENPEYVVFTCRFSREEEPIKLGVPFRSFGRRD